MIGAGHNNIEALLRPSGAFVDKLIEFLDIHVPARKGDPMPPIPVPQCIERYNQMNSNGLQTRQTSPTQGYGAFSRTSNNTRTPWGNTDMRRIEGIA